MKSKITLAFLFFILLFNNLFSQGKPNIILIITDDMGWSETSTGLTNLNNPSDFYETPNLETLASEGIAFPHAYVNGANCAPTRAAILSGQYAARPTNNVFNVYDLNRGNDSSNSTLIGPTMGLSGNNNIDEIPASAITIAETLKTAGYATAHFGKYHMGENENTNVSNNAPTDQGFDKNYGGGTAGTPGVYHASNSGGWKWHSNIQGTDLDPYAAPYTSAESEIILGAGNTSLSGTTKHVTDAITLAALDFMNGNNSNPFFMHFSNFAIHSPTANQHARPDLLAKYQSKKATNPSAMGHNNVGLAAILEGMDQSIGVLVNYLKNTDDPRNPGHKLADNTLIYFISDNGGAENTQENGPLRGMKGEYYEGGIRSVTVAWTGGNLLANKGTVNTTPIIAFDLYPTFAEAAGATLPVGYDIDGVSQWQMLTNGTSMTRESLFWHFPGYLIDSKRTQKPVTVIRKGNYKLHHFYETAEYELYDIINDISETTNLLPSTDPAIIDIANDMIADMQNHLTSTNAPLPTFRDTGATVPTPTSVSLDITPNSTDGCQVSSGYEAYWDFDTASNADDASGNNHNPNIITGTLTYDSSDFKEGDQSVIFDGSTEIQYSNGAFLSDATTMRSITVWIKPSSLSGTQEIFEEGGSGNGLALRLNNATIEARLTNNTDPDEDVTASFPSDGAWHHVALVFDGANTTLSLYIDGVLANSNTSAFSVLDTHSSPGGIGGVISGDAYGSASGDSFFTGKMDALALYNAVLSETEIQNSACYSSSCTTILKTDFEAFWDFDIANNANDVSGNGHHPQIPISSGISFDSSDFKDGDQSIVFDGTEAIQYATNSSSPDDFLNTATSSRSIAVWVKPSNLTGNQNIFDEGGNNNGIAVRLSGNKLESVVRDSNSNASIIDATFPNDGKWHHVAMTYNGSSHKLYIDASEVASNETGVPATVTSHASYGGIGGKLSSADSFQNTNDAFFIGKMDAFVVSNSALSSDEINSLTTPWYLGVDNDNDTYFGNQIIVNQCASPGVGYTLSALSITDCDDTKATVYPGAPEIADGLDNNCDATIDEGITYTFNGTWSPADPSGFNTNAPIIINASNAVITSNTVCTTLTVNSGASLTVNSGVTLTINDAVNGLTLESTSTAYSSLIVDGTVTGTVLYKRHINNTTTSSRGNDLISAPLSGQAFNDFAVANSNIPVVAGNTLLFGPYKNTNPTAYESWDTSNTTQLIPGVGYRSGSTNNGSFTFSGTVNTGSVTVALTSPAGGSKWNLIGNPYPSYLKINDGVDGFLNNTTNQGLLEDSSKAIYGYNATDTGGIWTIYNLANTDANTLIAPGQGFFVASKTETGGDIQFTPAMRSIGDNDDFIQGKSNKTNLNLKLQIASDSKLYKTDFYFNNNSTLGLDPGYDAAVYSSSAPKFAIYSHLVNDNIGRDMAIQSLNTKSASDVLIPIGINAIAGEQVTVSISNSTLSEAIFVYLEDNVANKRTLLNNENYTFTATEDLTTTGRFFINLKPAEILAVDDLQQQLNSLVVYTSTLPKTIIVNGQLTDITTLNLFDIQGRKVFTQTLDQNTNSNKIDVSRFDTGIYIVQIKSNAIYKTQKVIIR
ncbi:T9SS C-terminal target domain-containing protein [Lutibacter sp. HS1-25]|uniref:LamG-like jellyroll fold domain-containing protein n=1 Tax=Lutibacter sp. HS1-25 TaxID=2485000 RepID=UPI0010105E52|nr:LamG-like jellyroll fold domain-containing protein [Lutibacter sp. HS1-25]RXP60901.1 T9SS C-terminal target domain-containing protein [Lutibacter sp. HS1-25]